MSKRKNDLEHITKKIRKLEEELQRIRRRKESSSSSSSESLDLQNDAGEEFMIHSLPPSPAEEVEVISSEIANETSTEAPLPEVSIEVPKVDETLPDEILEILGEDPTLASQAGPDIRKELANRLNHIAVSGLDKEVRKELFQNKNYMIPANSEQIAAPLLNLELKSALPESATKRDKGLENRQKQIASTISCIARVVDRQIADKDSRLTKELMDSLRMLCDVQYLESMRRRFFIMSCLKKEVSEHLRRTKIDKYLFGENIADTLKTAKTVSKSRADIIKFQDNNNNKGTSKWKPKSQSQDPKGLNYKAPPARRQPAQARSFPPAPVRRQDDSSKGSRHQQQYRNRRRD